MQATPVPLVMNYVAINYCPKPHGVQNYEFMTSGTGERLMRGYDRLDIYVK